MKRNKRRSIVGGDIRNPQMHNNSPEQMPILHQRASAWCEQNGLRADAIRYALAAEDFTRAADLIELVWPEMDRAISGKGATGMAAGG